MPVSPTPVSAAVASSHAALQHGPKPLPLFLDILWRETAQDATLRQRAFAGLRVFQKAIRPARSGATAVYAAQHRARLLHYDDERNHEPSSRARTPIVLVPSLINPPHVLDLSAERSLLRWLTNNGFDAYLVDWGEPSPNDRAQDLDAHVRDLLLPLLSSLAAPPILVGYCLGGTLAIAAANLMPVTGLATIAAPWSFSAYDDEFRAQVSSIWDTAFDQCDALGLVPMEVLQTGFWNLDPARTIQKYADFGALDPDSATATAFILLEDWANSGAPLPFATGVQFIEEFYGLDAPGCAQWRINGRSIRPQPDGVPTIAFASTRDRLVPATATPPADEIIPLSLGHVGMMIGGQAREKLWQPLSQWLDRVISASSDIAAHPGTALREDHLP